MALCLLGLFVANGCTSDSSAEPTLRDGLTAEYRDFTGVSISSAEAECLDLRISTALKIPYPATWADYKEGMKARLVTITSAFESSGVVGPDSLPGEVTTACLTEEHSDAMFAVSLVPPTKWSDLTDVQRACLLDATRPYQVSVSEVDTAQQLKATCDIS